MINARNKVQVTLDRCHLVIALFCLTSHVVFVVLRGFLAKFALNNERKRVWNLIFASEYFSNKTCPVNIDRIDRSEIRLVEATFNKVLYVELQVQPYSLQDHARWHPSMHGLSRYIVLRVSVWL